ncbi:MAG: ATP-dependent DNA ligase [Acidimicrobiia bacterium]|nr:ATP-dependent DNA ligase [Acidimicrobiia bacterium]
MLFTDVVAASTAVAATRSRKEKVVAIAAALRRADDAELPVVAGWLAGDPRQGKIGVGWSLLDEVRLPDDQMSTATVPTLAVAEIDSLLDDLATARGSGSTATRVSLLTDVMARATSEEDAFLRRLLIGDLRQGALESLVVDGIAAATETPARAARRALMLSGDLGATALLARIGGVEGLDAVQLEVLRPVQPMLAATADDAGTAVADLGPSSVEWKLDGARIQAHRSGETVRLYTRNLNDITDRLPEVVATVLGFGSRDLVLDGEVIGLDAEARPRAFQDTMSRFGRDDAASHPATLDGFFFDVLHLDGVNMIDEPLGDRLDALADVAPDRCVPGIRTDDADVARAFAADAISAGHEGVMVKALDSRYQAGRRGKTWRKVKPVHTLDLVVLAAEWGHGRRTGWLSNLHLGARGPDGTFVMVGKTFKGLTDALLDWQTAELLAREERRTTHTVFVRPELVVEIALDGVQRSTRYPGGIALRFARVRGYRDDKRADEADTIDTARALLAR